MAFQFLIKQGHPDLFVLPAQPGAGNRARAEHPLTQRNDYSSHAWHVIGILRLYRDAI
jgi:hypothetical protein